MQGYFCLLERRNFMNKRRKKILKNMTISDQLLHKLVFKNNTEAVNLILSILMPYEVMPMVNVNTEQVICGSATNIHDVQYDIFGQDMIGNSYDIEFQVDEIEYLCERMIVYMCRMISNNLKRGEKDYRMLRSAVVIFICYGNTFDDGNPIQCIDPFSQLNYQCMLPPGYIILIDGNYEGDDALGMLLKDFKEPDPAKMHYDILAKSVAYFKYNKKGQRKMNKTMVKYEELIRKEERQKTWAEAEKALREQVQKEAVQRAKHLAIKLYLNGNSIQIIADCLSYPEEEVASWVLDEQVKN
jgi:predicted transposase/invertase (TIGR01784 family)